MIEFRSKETQRVPWKDRRHIEKKILPKDYNAIITGRKRSETCRAEEDIKPGDLFVMREWDGEQFTGRRTTREVITVLKWEKESDVYCGFM